MQAGVDSSAGIGSNGPAPSVLLSLRAVSKSFGGCKVLDEASLNIREGEVHALLGENGAGKSTLMNVLNGLYAPDAGEIRLNGKSLAIHGPRDAIAAGIGMVHQHFRLVDRFSAAENLLLASGGRGQLASHRAAAEALRRTGEECGLKIDPKAIVGEVSIAERQRIEICKVLALGVRILILDEPTAVLTDQEAADLLVAIGKLSAAGKAVILITHKLREVSGHCDRVTVMRQGKTVAADIPAGELNVKGLAQLMVADAVQAASRRTTVRSGQVCLKISLMSACRADGSTGVSNIDLSIRSGEVLGIAGVGGNGQQQLADAVSGLGKVTDGRIEIDGRDITHVSIADRRSLGLRIIPADRTASGLVSDLSVAENLAMTRVKDHRFGGIFLSRAKIAEEAKRAIAAYNIAGATPDRTARLLSGGNAQKIILARELGEDVKVLVAHSPTRGLDVKATAFVHKAIRKVMAEGAACLLISEDLEEVLALSNRIAVMSRGRIVGELAAGASPAQIGAMMLGHA